MNCMYFYTNILSGQDELCYDLITWMDRDNVNKSPVTYDVIIRALDEAKREPEVREKGVKYCNIVKSLRVYMGFSRGYYL